MQRADDALSPNTMSTSMQDDDHSEASSLSSFEGLFRSGRRKRAGASRPWCPVFDRLCPEVELGLDSARPTSAANAEELGCTRLNRLIFIGGRDRVGPHGLRKNASRMS